MLYTDWGFSDSPFQSTPLPANRLGSQLLVGRDRELQALRVRLLTGPKMPTLEGVNGIGKTSVVNVAAYSLYGDHIKQGSVPLFLPCRSTFQLDPSLDLSEFSYKVLLEVAQTLIERKSDLTKSRQSIDLAPLDRWMNQPQTSSVGGGVSYVQANFSRSNNEASGFEKSGLKKAVTDLLRNIFIDGGGVICIIDNLELLQQSAIARRMIESLRDELLNIQGIRWVLCGALGIVHSFASSPRLEGYLHDPITIGEIAPETAPRVLQSRVAALSSRETPYLPLLPEDFTELLDILQGNLRTTLSYSDDYCVAVADNQLPKGDEEKHRAFQAWLRAKSQSARSSSIAAISPRATRTFNDVVDLGGVFSPSQFGELGFNSMEAMRPPIRELEEVGLLTSTRDDTDKRRKTIQLTAKGWLVVHHTSMISGVD